MTGVAVNIHDRFLRIQERINHAAGASGRTPESICLVVVTKGHTLERIREVVGAGARWLGENYAEEAVEKITHLRPESGLEWHMIGHVQSRKAQIVAEYFDWMHTLDSHKLAVRLDRFAGQANRIISTLVEVNIGGENTKSGYPAWNVGHWERLADEIAPIIELPHLQLKGLMTVEPYFVDSEQVRPYFRQLRKLLDFLSRKFPGSCWEELSMGMSADFEIAIQEGATIVRIGEAIMGPRLYKAGQ